MNTVTLSTNSLPDIAIPEDEAIHLAGLKALPVAQSDDVSLAQLPAKMRRVEDISLGVILALLDSRGTLGKNSGARSTEQIIAELGAAPRHHWLVRRWLSALVERQFVSKQDGQYCYHDQFELESLEGPEALPEAYECMGFPPEMAQAHLALIAELGALISDETTISDLLFQDGQVLESLAAYQSNWFTGYLNHAAGFVVDFLAKARAKSGQKPKMLSLLELGGGAGLTTSAVLGSLKGRPVNYRFTDVSPLFTKAVQKKFRHQIGLRSSLLDINVDFAEQSIATESVDVVVAGNVLHNAAHIGESLKHIRAALKPGGVMLFTESVRENHAMLTAMQFLLSPAEGQALLGSEDRRAVDENLFIDAKAWQEELENAGFELALCMPGGTQSPLAAAGQALFVAVATEVLKASKVELDSAEGEQLQQTALSHGSIADATVVEAANLNSWALFLQALTQSEEIHHSDNNLAKSLNTQLAKDFEQVDMHQAVKVTDALNHTALLSMLNAFSRVGLFADSDAKHTMDEILAQPPVAETHRPLIRRWIKVLTEEQLLCLADGRYSLAIDASQFSDAAMDDAWTGLGQDWEALSGAQETIEYAKDNAAQLPALIRGEIQAVHLLFPRGGTERASALYREGVAARYQQFAVRELLQSIAGNWPADKPLQILEVGAGTGATTEGMLPMLDEMSQRINLTYQFTDVSTAFSESFFAKHNPAIEGKPSRPWLRRGLYDIDADPRSQGVAENSVDVVVAGGVFNAARVTDDSLAWIRKILRPGGWFIMTEPTSEEFWVMASQAFMLQHAEDDRAEAEATFLSLPQWYQALEGADLQLVLDLPPADHPLSAQGHRVFALRAKTHNERITAEEMQAWLSEQQPSMAPPAYIEVLDSLPRNDSGEVDVAKVQTWANQQGNKE